ncbi:hypothetical protein BpHYR1_010361, partial [Brachionus plicatilis]
MSLSSTLFKAGSLTFRSSKRIPALFTAFKNVHSGKIIMQNQTPAVQKSPITAPTVKKENPELRLSLKELGQYVATCMPKY